MANMAAFAVFLALEIMIKRLLIFLVRGYQLLISPIFPPSCRYWPTCSTYMLQALQKHGAFKGLLMGSARIIRCNPWVKGGVDPVPNFFTLKRHPHPELFEDAVIAAKYHHDKIKK